MTGVTLYIFVLLFYFPGLAILAFNKRIWDYPALAFTFVGMFALNAFGSIDVLGESTPLWRIEYDRKEVAQQCALLLVLQALIFYSLVLPYVYLRPMPAKFAASTCETLDSVILAIGLIVILSLGIFYLKETRTFLAFQDQTNLTPAEVLELRINLIYGLKLWPLYNLGFVFLPTFISGYAVLIALSRHRINLYAILAILVCFAASLSMGSKAGLINFAVSMSIASAVWSAANGKNPFAFLRSRCFLIFFGVCALLLVLGYARMNSNLAPLTLLGRIWYRSFVAAPEAISGAISFTIHQGFIGVHLLPTLRGLFPHQQWDLVSVLHQYVAGEPGGLNVPFAAQGYIAWGWFGVCGACIAVYSGLIAIQEISFRLRNSLFSLAFLSLYAYLGVMTAAYGMLSTLYTLMFPSCLILLYLAGTVLSPFVRKALGLLRPQKG